MDGNSKGPLNLQLLNNSNYNNENTVLNSNNSNRSIERYPFNGNSNQNKHLPDLTNRIINLDNTFLNKNDVNILDLYSINKPSKYLNSQSISKQTCKADKWYFTECPQCSCNGHSQCKAGTSICNKPCLHDTEGEHCEECKQGFFGNAINGGKCLACKCNGHSHDCDKRTGRCFCTTKGMIGHHCQNCDQSNHYFGNPTKESTCFYNLSIDFQYTFNMSKNDDRHYNKINFMNMPHRPDLDVDFTISCSNRALFNISFGSGEVFLVSNLISNLKI